MIPAEIRDRLPEGAFVEVLLVDLTLAQARDYVPSDLYEQTELPIRHEFKMSSDDYWAMTVAEHTAVAQYLRLGVEDGR